MIVSRTPLRVSFVGGGTDLRAFYEKSPGRVLSTAINKYVYIALHDKFDGKITLNYSQRELVDSIDEIKHPIFREAMRLTGVKSAIEISSMADIPSSGSGLGSSSSFTVGILNALHAYKGEVASAEQLAQEASKIEIEILGEPIGKQDQYIAAYGGMRLITFNKDETVSVESVKCSEGTKRALEEQLLMFYTGITRKASSILSEQKKNTAQEDKFTSLKGMADLALSLKKDLEEDNADSLGKVLKDAWEAKKKLATGISNAEIDEMYSKAIAAGATGGKILGAGGGGFLLMFAPREKANAVRKALHEYREVNIRFDPLGSVYQRL